MRCPFCGNEDTQVRRHALSSAEASSIRRRRKCQVCDKRFTTYERVELKMPQLVKKDGSRTDFDRDKLRGSMMLALRKRPVATERGGCARWTRIEEKLRSLGEREVPTSRVGDLVMRELAKLDKVAYIRFASVYRSFESPDDFRDAVQEVEEAAQEARGSDRSFSAFDHAMMRRALALAEKRPVHATPNPRVGCVLAQGERVVGEGWHEKAGAPHAEAQALRAGQRGAAGATAYVTLEPCNHHGRTPPCADALIRRERGARGRGDARSQSRRRRRAATALARRGHRGSSTG